MIDDKFAEVYFGIIGPEMKEVIKWE